jgi:hypothetical protein
MWRFQGAEQSDFSYIGIRKIDLNQRERSFVPWRASIPVQQSEFQSVGLRLDGIKQNARHTLAVNDPRFPCIDTPLVGRRKYFVSISTRRIKVGNNPEGGSLFAYRLS